MLEREDDLDRSSVQSSHATAEAHELVQVCHPLGAGLWMLLWDDHALTLRERVVDVVGQLVLATD